MTWQTSSTTSRKTWVEPQPREESVLRLRSLAERVGTRDARSKEDAGLARTL